MSCKQLIAGLNRVDWDFPGSSTPAKSVHSLHWFPGNFIPQIPSYLIQLLSSAGDTVCDPFCGSGTTGVEALRLGRLARQSDVNRAGLEVAQAKIEFLSSPTIAADLESMLEHIVWDFIPDGRRASKKREDSKELSLWFHSDTLRQLEYLWEIVQRPTWSQSRAVLDMLFTDTLFACAATGRAVTSGGGIRRHHWGWVADNVRPKTPYPHNAIIVFRRRVVHALSVAEIEEPLKCSVASDSVRWEDARRCGLPDESVDLIVTSPPYCGMIDYTMASRLTYLWKGWSLETEIPLEIGARRYRNRRDFVSVYLQDLALAQERMHSVLRKDGYCALVIGSSSKHPEAVRCAIDGFQKQFNLIWGPTARRPRRRRVSKRTGGAPTEYVLVFQK